MGAHPAVAEAKCGTDGDEEDGGGGGGSIPVAARVGQAPAGKTSSALLSPSTSRYPEKRCPRRRPRGNAQARNCRTNEKEQRRWTSCTALIVARNQQVSKGETRNVSRTGRPRNP